MLLPHLCAEVRECTRALGALRWRVKDYLDAIGDEELARMDEELGGRVHRAGWLFASLGATSADDLARGRREREGLRWMLGALAAARAVRLVPGVEALPELAPAASPEVPVLAAWCALSAGAEGELRWSAACNGAGLAFELAVPGSVVGELASRCARLATPPLVELVLGRDRLELRWSEERAARRAGDP